MIVKVQMSQFTSDRVKHMLIYDKTRQHTYEGIASKDVIAVMGNDPKAFFEAELVDDPNKQGAKRFKLIKRVKWQDW